MGLWLAGERLFYVVRRYFLSLFVVPGGFHSCTFVRGVFVDRHWYTPEYTYITTTVSSAI